jgi:hypothetical protein
MIHNLSLLFLDKKNNVPVEPHASSEYDRPPSSRMASPEYMSEDGPDSGYYSERRRASIVPHHQKWSGNEPDGYSSDSDSNQYVLYKSLDLPSNEKLELGLQKLVDPKWAPKSTVTRTPFPHQPLEPLPMQHRAPSGSTHYIGLSMAKTNHIPTTGYLSPILSPAHRSALDFTPLEPPLRNQRSFSICSETSSSAESTQTAPAALYRKGQIQDRTVWRRPLDNDLERRPLARHALPSRQQERISHSSVTLQPDNAVTAHLGTCI